MSKFVAKFRNNDYDEEYGFKPKKKSKNKYDEIRRMRKNRHEDYDPENYYRSGASKYRKSY